MDFSIVIPTYNRADILARTLAALAGQHSEFEGRTLLFEVIVVNDGSRDHTEEWVLAWQKDSTVPLTYLRQTNQKQGAARNFGASRAEGRLLIFLGDDTVPAPNFLIEHWKSHRQNESGKAVIGYTPWPAEIRPTSFMRYIGEEGWQFGFSLIDDPEDVPFNFFYTSNISLDRRFFLNSGGFDEDFREYGWEDVELSLRLKQQGMRLTYNPHAIAYHFHPTSLRDFSRRQRKVGYSAWTLYAKHPELARFLNIDQVQQYGAIARLRLELLAALCSLTEKWEWLDLSRYYPDLMSYYYNLGLLEADRSVHQ